MENERELGWDDTIQNDSSAFTLLPAGDYPFTIALVERARHTPNPQNPNAKLPACNKAVVHVQIDGGPLGQVTVKENLYLHSMCEGLLCQFFTAIGQRKHGDALVMDWSSVAGCTGMCQVKHRTGKGDAVYHDVKLLEPQATQPPTTTNANASF